MSSSTYNTISNALTTGTIIAIVVGSIVGLAVLIAVIIIIVCIVKHSNRSKIARQGMILQQAQPYPYPHPNQYPPNMMSVANYPPAVAPYTSSGPGYA